MRRNVPLRLSKGALNKALVILGVGALPAPPHNLTARQKRAVSLLHGWYDYVSVHKENDKEQNFRITRNNTTIRRDSTDDLSRLASQLQVKRAWEPEDLRNLWESVNDQTKSKLLANLPMRQKPGLLAAAKRINYIFESFEKPAKCRKLLLKGTLAALAQNPSPTPDSNLRDEDNELMELQLRHLRSGLAQDSKAYREALDRRDSRPKVKPITGHAGQKPTSRPRKDDWVYYAEALNMIWMEITHGAPRGRLEAGRPFFDLANILFKAALGAGANPERHLRQAFKSSASRRTPKTKFYSGFLDALALVGGG